MRTTIGSVIRRDRRGLLLTITAVAIGFVWPGEASAAPSFTASLMGGVIGQAQYGTVKGRLIWGGDEIPEIKVLEAQGKAEKDPAVCAKSAPVMSRELVIDPSTKGVSYAFAYISRPKGANPEAIKELMAKMPTVELDQKNCEFLPYLVPMYQEQTLIVKASDPGINHNVRLNAFANPGLNQNVAAGGKLTLHLVAERLPIKLQCDIHPWMKSYVMVFDHPFFTTTGKDGSFEIKGVPAGSQNLVIWQERVGYANPNAGRGMPVTITAGETTDVGEIRLDAKKAIAAGG
jgi:hypothetical protein